MNISDVVSLARAGYKMADIKELLATEEKEKKDEKPDEEEKDEKDEKPDEKTDEEKGKEQLEEIDKLKKQVENLTKALKEAQKANTDADMSDKDKKDDVDVLTDFVKSFM